ncbi:hypothetical protein [Nonomuraea sp. NPDC049141]|uniref:DUF7620 family protein n=1 Tax=Nonomuraea sp. NPDC049141 TaxID=3155500 RepID=UPI00340FC4D1
MRTRKRLIQAELAAAEAAAQESARRAKADAAQAVQARRLGQELAAKIHAYNEANHFSVWIFDDFAGGTA